MKYTSWSAYRSARTKNPHMIDFQMFSRRQIEFGINLRRYRETHEMSTTDLAFRCSCFGKPFKVKVSNFDISCYERFQQIPSEKKMKVIMMAIGITMEDLNERI